MLENTLKPSKGKNGKRFPSSQHIPMKKTKNFNKSLKNHYNSRRKTRREADEVIVILLFVPDTPFLSNTELIERSMVIQNLKQV
jgi:hypothetical protein